MFVLIRRISLSQKDCIESSAILFPTISHEWFPERNGNEMQATLCTDTDRRAQRSVETMILHDS